ncbi:MAG TPA: histidine kinase [Ornithinibacter sp.]|nr:histidine kinase [Ornithinibacter sp.]
MAARPTVGWRDVALPAALAALGVLEIASATSAGWPAAVVLTMLSCTVLVVRSTSALVVAPLSVALLFAITLVSPELDEASTQIGIVALATYSLGRHLTLRRGLVGMALVASAITVITLVADQRLPGLDDVLFLSALFVPPFVLGRVVRRVVEQSAELLRQQEWIEREAARGERLRIARELHDVLAHSLSAMVVQTAAARDLVRTDPAAAEAGLDAVAEAGRAALTETGRMLHVLRDDDDEMALGPAPTLARLDDLVGAAQTHGLRVEVTLAPDAAALTTLPPTVDVSAFRIVQEALTNVARHSTGDRADLSLTVRDDALDIEVANDWEPASAAARRGLADPLGSGLGVTGMAERAALFGGHVDRRVTDGRHVLTVHLPLHEAPATPSPSPSPSSSTPAEALG